MVIFNKINQINYKIASKVINKASQKIDEKRYGKFDDSMTEEEIKAAKEKIDLEKKERRAVERERRAAESEEHRRLQEIEAEKQRKEEEERENIKNWIFAYAFKRVYKEDGSSVLTCPQCTGTNISATTWEEKNADLEEDNGSYLKRICAACGHTQTINLDNPSKIYENKFW